MNTDTDTVVKRTESSTSDLALIDIILRNESQRSVDEAKGKIFTKYYQLLIFRLNFLGDKEEINDLVSISLTKCFRNIDKYDRKYAFSTWIFSIARNLSIDYMRKTRLNTVSLSLESDSEHKEIQLQTNSLTPEQELIRSEKHEELRNAVEIVLNNRPHLKEIIELRYYKNLSYSEIEKFTGKPIGTVKAHVFRAKKLLRIFYKKRNLDR